ncbi:hypothetical protein OEZ85_012249 [Tetradesmus obliquus]|uniref:Cytochrome c oxidase assembly protein COX19 n=1 Tax=Tetradesmus obliquus TaxID=3088 RepID=A0ABY8TSR7_TETOB|nr:hypothetical protein OEZ85_012249 [Tetradesmus obliquus]
MSAFGGPRGASAKPPEKGIFPLDHFGECKQVADAYLKCLKQHARDAVACQELAKKYLQCRMERNLMARQDLKELGFKEQGAATSSSSSNSSGSNSSSSSSIGRSSRKGS